MAHTIHPHAIKIIREQLYQVLIVIDDAINILIAMSEQPQQQAVVDKLHEIKIFLQDAKARLKSIDRKFGTL